MAAGRETMATRMAMVMANTVITSTTKYWEINNTEEVLALLYYTNTTIIAMLSIFQLPISLHAMFKIRKSLNNNHVSTALILYSQ